MAHFGRSTSFWLWGCGSRIRLVPTHHYRRPVPELRLLIGRKTVLARDRRRSLAWCGHEGQFVVLAGLAGLVRLGGFA